MITAFVLGAVVMLIVVLIATWVLVTYFAEKIFERWF